MSAPHVQYMAYGDYALQNGLIDEEVGGLVGRLGGCCSWLMVVGWWYTGDAMRLMVV